jgi:aminoglycoside phosphotransferase (APT) family kinase protein
LQITGRVVQQPHRHGEWQLVERSSFDREALLALFPEDRLGTVHTIERIGGGLSGAGVYAVITSRGEYVLRIQAEHPDEAPWTQQLLILRRAVERGVAPPIMLVDQPARAIISARIDGVPLAAALGDPTQRRAVLTSVVEQVRLLHGVDTSGVSERDPIAYARDIAQAQGVRPGFPLWAAGLDATIASIAALLANDARRVVSHNDLNPGNLIWDGVRAWIVDWEVAGLGHPHYDLATLAMFLNLDDEMTLELIALHDQMPPDATSLANFAALRRLSALLCGVTFLSLVSDLSVAPMNPPTLSSCYADMRTGALDLQTARGRAAFGLALLHLGTARSAPGI